jgi:hypothetical protein
MSDDYKTCTGTINYHLHKMGTDPFSPRSPIVGQDKGTVVLCQLLKYKYEPYNEQ